MEQIENYVQELNNNSQAEEQIPQERSIMEQQFWEPLASWSGAEVGSSPRRLRGPRLMEVCDGAVASSSSSPLQEPVADHPRLISCPASPKPLLFKLRPPHSSSPPSFWATSGETPCTVGCGTPPAPRSSSPCVVGRRNSDSGEEPPRLEVVAGRTPARPTWLSLAPNPAA